MKILVTGSTGLVGSALIPALAGAGHEAIALRRVDGADARNGATWDPVGGEIDSAMFGGVEAVVHLAGEGISSKRWSNDQMRRIHDSRQKGTRLLAAALAALESPPKVLISASAIGFYGDRGDEELDEESGPGENFLSGVCQSWEQATKPAADAGIRVANLRFGVILSARGGALGQMLTPFSFGLGGKIGSGEQHVSWVAIDDAVDVIVHALNNDSLSGPVNVVAPRAVTNVELTRTLGQVLGRPTFLPMPAFAARLLFGQMADELLLVSARVAPKKLERAGYAFRFNQLEPALRHILGKK